MLGGAGVSAHAKIIRQGGGWERYVEQRPHNQITEAERIIFEKLKAEVAAERRREREGA